MSIIGDIREENLVHDLAKLISEKIEANQNRPEVVQVLKEVGIRILEILPTIPEWSYHFAEKFRL